MHPRQWIKQFHYKELFLVGFYMSFIVITSIAVVVDLGLENYLDVVIELIFITLCSLFFIYFLHSRDQKVAARAIIWTGAAVTFVFCYINNYDITMVFTLLLPIAAFILIQSRELVINMTLYYLLLLLLLVYGYHSNENHPLLHDATALSTFIIAQLFTIAFGLFYTFAIEDSHRKLEKANDEKEILLKEIHHRVKNNLNVIASIVDLQSQNTDSNITNQLLLTQGRIESIAIVHEMLYSKQDNFAKINFEEYINRLCHMVERLHVKQDVEYKINGYHIVLPINVMLDLGLITNELLTNAHKHAFHHTLKPKIQISLSKDEEGIFQYYYKDNGCGIEKIEELKHTDSLGIRLIILSAEKMDAALSFENANGFKTTMIFSL